MGSTDGLSSPDRGRSVLWWFLGGAALVSLLFYRGFVFAPGQLIFGSDMLFEGISLRQFYVEEIRAGRGVPLWTPHVYGGMPFVALLPGPIFYPTTLLYFLMPLYRAIGWTFVLHTFLAGGFAYFMARSFRLRRASAVVCGASFMLTGYVTSHLYGGHDGRMFAMVLIPLALGLLNRGLESGEPRWFAGLSVVVATQVFTPHTQVMYFSSLALSLFFLFHVLVRIPRETGAIDWRRYLRPTVGFVLAFLGAIALAGPQLFPTLALLDDVVRAASETGYDFAASYALPPQELTALFLPDLIGSLGVYWGQNPLKLHTEYLGAVPIALALLGVAAGFGGGLAREHRRMIGFLVTASLLGVLFALGAATPIHRIAYTILPLIGSLRGPAMMLGPVTVFVALLAAYGWEAVLEHREASEPGGISRVALGILAAPVFVLGLAAALSPEGLMRFALLSWYPAGWPLQPHPTLTTQLQLNGLVLLAGFGIAWGVGYGVARRKVGQLGLVAVLVFGVGDLWRVDARYLQLRTAETALAPDPLLGALIAERPPGARVWAPDVPGPVRNYRPNEVMYHGISSAGGRQKFLLEPYARLVGGIRPDEGLAPVAGLLDVRYLILPFEREDVPSIAEAGGRYAYPVSELPHAYFPAEITLVEDTAGALAATREIADPRVTSVVESVSGRAPPVAGRGAATISRYEPDLIELELDVQSAGLLVVSEIHHPGWRAFVDDVETQIWRANTALRGVEVPVGATRVRFVYHSRSFSLGLWTALLTALGIAVIGVVSWRRSRARDPV